ncbi:SDR family NAD(P)-dependent oxidoreductase [Neobacillus sp. FSL H8-0543]|uniref:SDR family NAD(P)-dependent oxidoreductase n=1 Tax=Neobacillus sp. FSL H8-0543 TaxID=2954672 RepID=UPI0031590DCA
MISINLENQVVLVTGAGTGIGKAIALKLAEAGAKVAVNYNSSREEAQKVVSTIVEHGGTAKVYQCDVTNEEAVQAMYVKIEDELGEVDILVNNAGSLVERCVIEEMSSDLWQSIVDVNQKSVFLCSKYAIPNMKVKKNGRIVNVSSIAARNGGGIGAAMYASSKAAVSAFTKGLAKELVGHGILVNAVSPGVITTPFHDRFTSDEAREQFKNVIPLSREGSPSEVADAVLFLVSPLSTYLVGENIEVNGGQLMD